MRGGRRPWRGRRGAAVAALLVLGAALAGMPRPALGDPAVAQILIEQGKKAIAARDYDTAVQRLERAREEDAAQIEAAYLLGTVFEKTNKPGAAVAAYRSFRDAAAEHQRAGTLEKRLVPLLKKSEERIAILGKGQAEFVALQDAFARKVLELARRVGSEDADLARYALSRLLAVAPGHAEAQKALDALEGTTDVGRADRAPIPGIEKWTDLLLTKAIPPSDAVTYLDRILAIEDEGGSVYWTESGLSAEEPAVFEMEFRCTKELQPTWLVGLALGRVAARDGKAGEFVSVFVQRTKVVAVQAVGGRNVDLGTTTIPPVGDGWHRLAAALEDGKLRVFLDGKRLSSTSVPGRDSLAGEIGVFHQRCRAEIRTLRLGTAK